MKKCIVIGGGFAGLSASAYLANAGVIVELLEASPKLGGRAYSFLEKETNTIVDNGQHLQLGCYYNTLDFLNLIGSSDKVQVQKKMSVNFLKPNFELHELKSSSLPYPLNLFSAILNYTAVSLRERLSILRLFSKLPFYSNRDLEKISVEEFLIKEKQNENLIKAFWEILCVGALNTNLTKASAKILADILKIIFLSGNEGSKFVIPKEGLSEIYCQQAKKFIEDRQGKISLSEKVEEISIEKNRANQIKTNKRIITDFDLIISAVPYYGIKKILSTLNFEDFTQEYSSILNVHIWPKENKLGNNFYGLIGSEIHWIFSHNSHLTCVISDADYLMDKSNEEIMAMIYSQLVKYLKISRDDITKYLIIKEKRATFIPSNKILYNRPNSETQIKNLYLAGDWVNTGLPSTIESAVKSGQTLANDIIAELKE